ncbi:MAG TPA: tripartite tricarboxylate transporter TctB family protein [Roseococcus sp.]|jgi:hypothetical protein|nr:tripartite tricarboxylate transporter TctB family protein [Roseococcus sp.]
MSDITSTGFGLPGAVPGPLAAARGVSVRTMEIATAAAFAMIGGVAIWDSARLGAGWGGDGPQSGYFPFWIGTVLVLAAMGQLIAAARGASRAEGGFLTWEQGRTVMTVLVPTAIFVLVIPHAGLYLPAAALVAWFMCRLGGFGLARGLASGGATAAVTFVVFEIWFLVALPKGPIETALGY